MSRGLGHVQRSVLDHLGGAAGVTTFETLRWELWGRRESGGRPDATCEQLPGAWNTTVRRAVAGLERDKHIATERRRLDSFDECVTHFPNKTLIANVRKLRLDLLPVLRGWTQGGRVRSRYGRYDNELFYLKSLKAEEMKERRRAWTWLEPALTRCLASFAKRDRDLLFLLVAKGKNLFETDEITCRRSFALLAERLLEHSLLSAPVAQRLRELCRLILPPDEVGFLQLKGLVHEFAYVPRYRRGSLKTDTVDWLEKDPESKGVLEKLPGYEAPVEASRHGPIRFAPGKAVHSKLLNSLFDQTVFQKFQFVRSATASS